MRITRIDIYKYSVKLKEAFVTSLGRHEYAENVAVLISTETGIKGAGECSPFMTINGESAETCFVVAHYLAKTLHGKDPLKVEECSGLMDAVIYGNASIKSAFDIALHDIASQHAGLPLYTFLGGNNKKPLVTDYTVSIGEVDKMAMDAAEIKRKGFQSIKVKLGREKDKDVERIRAIRKAIGNETPLRIDANQGWNTETAIATLKALAPYNIQYCEEPVPRWDFMELPRIKKESSIPVMADESCCDHHDAKRLIGLQACDLFNIKLGKSSGFFKAKKIIALAERAGIKMQVGGFLESRLGFTASAHLALTSDEVLYCDFDTPLMFEEDPVVGGITYDNNGVVRMPDTPGLGAILDEKFLERQQKSVIE